MKNTKKPLCGQCASGLVPGTPKTFDPACRGCVQKKDNGLRTGYLYSTSWLPHDAKHKTIIHELSVEGQMRAAGMPVRVVPNELSVADGINAARTVFPTLYFDEVKTQDGWQGLSHYQYEVDSVTNQFSKKPLHNWASHPADAFRTFAVAQKEPKRQGLQLPKRNRVIQTPVQRNGSWMV